MIGSAARNRHRIVREMGLQHREARSNGVRKPGRVSVSRIRGSHKRLLDDVI